MKRLYKTDNKGEEVNYFIGTEVEHTPQYGEKTLFVVGIKDPTEIQTIADFNGCKHVYIGANMSFNITDNTAEQWKPWEDMMFPLLKKEYSVTFDIDVEHVEGLLETGLTEYSNFTPMISVKLPYIEQLGYNACLKLDDRDFKFSNPGVWVHSIHDLKNRERFTDWSKYVTDEIID